jgi:hypothetical protein
MGARCHVMTHPFFATSAADGSFSVADLPAGEYVIAAWHERLGTQEIAITVGEDSEQIEFTFERKQRP